MNTKALLVVPAAVIAAALVARGQPVNGAGQSGQSVKSITLPSVQVDMPKGPGYEAFNARCVACHSPQYVLMQPNFSKEVWTNEVMKMRKVFGAPVGDEQVEDIVNYLASVRGNGK